MSERVAILTGGGDVPGLNMCVKSLVYRLIDFGHQPIGVRKGWEGLIEYNHRDRSTYGANFIELTKNILRASTHCKRLTRKCLSFCGIQR
jgi:6-phosphofructokinase